MMNCFVVGVLAFLAGVAVGIIGYFLTTIASYEKEIEAIFERTCRKYEDIISRKESENKRILEAYNELQKRIMVQDMKKQRLEVRNYDV